MEHRNNVRQGHLEHMNVLNGKKILFCLPTLAMGGAERQALLLAVKLRERYDVRPEIWGFGDEGPVNSLCSERDLPCCSMHFPFTSTTSRISKSIEMGRFIYRLRKSRFDILLPYTMFPNVLCGMLWKTSGAAACIWCQRDDGTFPRLSPMYERISVHSCSHFISNSEQGVNFLVDELRAPPGKITLIKNGIDLPAPELTNEQWRDKLNLPDKCFLVCMAANIQPAKDHETLLKAWRKVLKKVREKRDGQSRPLYLLLIGRPTPLESKLKDLANELQITDSVIFTGEVKDMSGLLDACDLAVFSSHTEGTPNGVLEPMSKGLAVAATDLPGVRDALGNLNSDYISSKGDVDAFAKNISRLIFDEKLRAEVGSVNKERIQCRFSAESLAEKTAQVIQDLL